MKNLDCVFRSRNAVLFRRWTSVTFSIYLSVFFGCCVITYYYRFSMQRERYVDVEPIDDWIFNETQYIYMCMPSTGRYCGTDSLLVTSYLMSRYNHFIEVFCCCTGFFMLCMLVNYSQFGLRQFLLSVVIWNSFSCLDDSWS